MTKPRMKTATSVTVIDPAEKRKFLNLAGETLAGEGVHASTIKHILDTCFESDDWIGWDTLTVYLDIKDVTGSDPSADTMERVAALQLVMASSRFFTDLGSFCAVANTLASGEPGFEVFDPVTPEEAGWAIAEVLLLRDMLPFSYGIRRYCQLILEQAGMDKLYPEVFSHVLGKADTYHETSSVDVFIDESLSELVAQHMRLGLSDKLKRLGHVQAVT